LEKKNHPLILHFQSVGFVIGLFELFLLFIAVIFGRLLGYKFTFIACLCIGIMVAIIFLSIIILNVAAIFIHHIYYLLVKKKKPSCFRY